LEERSFLLPLGRIILSTEPMNHRISLTAGSPSLFISNTDFADPKCIERRAGPVTLTAACEIEDADLLADDQPARSGFESLPTWKGLSAWSGSAAKRIFDCACVLFSLPVVLPLTLVIALAVRLTSRGPAFFLQERIGRHGRTFTIFKFRTMVHDVAAPYRAIATLDARRFTSIGPFLRRWKLDELPQLANVLLGHMSLVGPRPKMHEHARYDIPCRPGITGMATIVFACEVEIQASVPKDQLDAYFQAVVLPAKRQLDAEYMSRATFLSDLKLLVKSVLRRWDSAAFEQIVVAAALKMKAGVTPPSDYAQAQATGRKRSPIRTSRPVDAEEASVV
jgi:lipopolysaccharide/colanic/teichoic acid biosynthesis glycosyltransferase